jgi:two-component sensor histidine kinase
MEVLRGAASQLRRAADTVWSVGEPTTAGDSFEVRFRSTALRFGSSVGLVSLSAVVAALVLDGPTARRSALVGLTLLGGAANAALLLVPWRDWLPTRRGRLLVDAWSGGLIAFVATLVAFAGASFALLLFLALPFIAVVQSAGRRVFWLAISAATCTAVAALVPLPTGATALRLTLVAATVGIALLLARAIQREAARAELERALAMEARHRINNDLQTVADLLFLGRPATSDPTAFDQAAARVRAVASVHRLLTRAGDVVDAGRLVASIADYAPAPVTVDAEPIMLDGPTSQRLALVANELVTNAWRHGGAPITVSLSADDDVRLRVDDVGVGPGNADGLGLELVRRIAEHGLRGRLELARRPGGGTRAEVVFPQARR